MRYVTLPLLLAALASCKALGGQNDDAMAVNTVVKTYGKSADETWRAVQTALKEMDLRVESDSHDALGGTLVAARGTKDEIHVEARSQDAENTRLSVWVDPGDRSMAQIIQERVAERLGVTTGMPRSTQASGAQVEGTYDKKLDVCVSAAEAVMRDLKLPAPRREMHDTWARVDSQYLDSIPVQIRMERTRKDQTLVVFLAGTSASEDNRSAATKLKTEFEKHLSSAGEARP